MFADDQFHETETAALLLISDPSTAHRNQPAPSRSKKATPAQPNKGTLSSVLSGGYDPLQPGGGLTSVFAVCVYLSTGGFGIDISVVPSHKPGQKRNHNLTPDTYPRWVGWVCIPWLNSNPTH